jgi:membrane protein YqaA with SNARE-associated domain
MKAASIVFLGVLGIWLWVGIFAAGVLVDSEPYRKPFQSEDKAAATPPNAVAPAQHVLVAESLPPVSAGPLIPTSTATLKSYPRDLTTFGKAALFFTPLNAAVLALLAALVGGCASWLAHKDDKVPESASPDDKLRLERRLQFLRENPSTAMLRGFAVYLAVIAGVYITGGDPFADTSASQYMRFAGTISLLAYLVGYDPTRLQDLLDGLPRLGKKA